jgi:hypothetical protein
MQEHCERLQAAGSKCWWCFHNTPQGSVSVAMPVKMNGNYDSFMFEGVFCSWSCCRAYSDHEGGREAATRRTSIWYLAKVLTGIPMMTTIEAAPDRNRLAVLGGDLTIDAFRAPWRNLAYTNQTVRVESNTSFQRPVVKPHKQHSRQAASTAPPKSTRDKYNNQKYFDGDILKYRQKRSQSGLHRLGLC